jgi:hypothetical protein
MGTTRTTKAKKKVFMGIYFHVGMEVKLQFLPTITFLGL